MLDVYPISHCDTQDSIHNSCNPSFIHVAVTKIVSVLHRTLFSNKIPHVFLFFYNAAKKRKNSAREKKLPDTIRKNIRTGPKQLFWYRPGNFVPQFPIMILLPKVQSKHQCPSNPSRTNMPNLQGRVQHFIFLPSN